MPSDNQMSFVAGIRHLHVTLGHPDPDYSHSMLRLQQVLRGVRSILSKNKPQEAQRTRLPITPELLLKIRKVWEKNSREHDFIMLWAACTICFFGFFRPGEITAPSDKAFDPNDHLTFGDIAVDCLSNPYIIRVRLKRSKTDPFRRGMDVFIGRTHNALCPVSAMLAFLTVRGGRAGALFRFQDGRLLTLDRFVGHVREALSKAGVDAKNYSGHSFRSGAATTAARRGIRDATIKLLGRWRSCAYLLYVQTPRNELAVLSETLAHI